MTNHPRHIAIADFTYELPEERIARYPLAERDQSKLLIYDQGKITETTYRHLPDQLPENTTLIFNNTRVIQARMFFKKETGGALELFCLEPGDQYPDIQTAMQQCGSVNWKCLVGGASKWKAQTKIFLTLEAVGISIAAEMIEKGAGYYLIHFSWNNTHMSFAEILHHAGNLPLPPYMNRSAEADDHNRYQTVYADPEGSVAAPTAGLHFTPALLAEMDKKKIGKLFVTLHVGAGTFKPVKAETLDGHDMHAEFLEVSAAAIEQLLDKKTGKIVCVGTTSLRTTESLYWMGVKASLNPGITPAELEIRQWDPYEINTGKISMQEALSALLQWMKSRNSPMLIIKTQIMIAPGYRLRIADGIITNFHQPQSTLLLLISAITGNDWHRIYDYAMNHEFRFLSYGDGSLLWNNPA